MQGVPNNVLNQIMSIEGNNICIDCQAPNPTFVSINNAVFLCENCAYIHKGLGSHISLIKSLINEPLTLMEIALLRIGGNVRFDNLVKEYGIQQEQDKQFKYKLQFAEYYRSLLLAEVNKEGNPQEYEKIVNSKPSLEVGVQIAQRQSEIAKDVTNISNKIGSFFSTLSKAVNETAQKYGITQKFDEARGKFNEGVKNFGENHPSIKDAAIKTGEAFTTAKNYTAEALNKVIESPTVKNITGAVNNKYNEVINSETMNKIAQQTEEQYINLKMKAGYKTSDEVNNINMPQENNNINNEEPK